MNKEKKFTILSLVGGGIRGLMSTTILQRLYDYNQSIVLNTDLIAGCSTGSIITSELLAGKSPGDIVDLFTGSEIGFYNRMDSDPDKPAYPIDEVFASQFALHGNKTVNDAGRNVLFVTFDVGGLEERDGIMVARPWEPVMYTNMSSEGRGDTLIAKAATSSGAMPGQLGSFEGNVDGAFFNHDPTVAAIALAVSNGHKLEDIVAITIGTGLMYDWVASDTHRWGAGQWMNGVPNPFDNTPPFLMNQSTSSPMLDMCLNGTSTDLMPKMASMLLGDRYANINPHLPCFIPENSTSPQAIALLQRHGNTADLTQAKRLLDDYWIGLPGAADSRAARA